MPRSYHKTFICMSLQSRGGHYYIYYIIYTIFTVYNIYISSCMYNLTCVENVGRMGNVIMGDCFKFKN